MASPEDIWLVDFGDPPPGEPAHQRPALVVGPVALFGEGDFPFVFLVPLTTTHRGLSLHVEIDDAPSTGLDAVSYAQCELLRSVRRRRLVHRLGRVDAAASAAVDQVIRTLLGH